jgi:two-component system, OmpR family, sensor histidine kinase CiaH
VFSRVGRRLAVLNAVVVITVLAAMSLAMLLFLQSRLEGEVDHHLEDRADAAQVAWSSLFVSGEVVTIDRKLSLQSSDSNSEDDDQEDKTDQESEASSDLIQSGDTIAYALAPDGAILADARGVPIPDLPYLEALPAALNGETTFDDLMIDGESVRVLTEPAIFEGQVLGAIQVAQGQGEYDAALQVVRNASIGGLLLGALIAIPAGLFLASRSMKPVQTAFEKQQTFIADASHELRTPLTLLRAQAEFLQRSSNLTPEERAEGEATIIREVDSMNRLVSDLLLMARAEHPSLALERSNLDLSEIARAAVSSLQASGARKGVNLSASCPDRIFMEIDGERIQQILRILIDNAIRYTPSGGSVIVASSVDHGSCQVTVADTGLGIAPDDLDHIFDRFYRSDRSRNREDGGTGLGLAIAKTLAEAHGGSLTVTSQLQNGSIFTLKLPCR